MVAKFPKNKKPRTIEELKKADYTVLTVKEEMRKNLIAKIRKDEELFPGIVGYEETVIPQLENAILSGQDIIFLGERGQAKTRMMRSLVNLLDEEIPAMAGCEINDNPFQPICKSCQEKLKTRGEPGRDRLAGPGAAIRRETGHPGCDHRRPHRGGGPHQGCRRPLPLR